MLDNATTINLAFQFALASTASLIISHMICVGVVMHYDLSGKWDQYKLHKSRNVSLQDYTKGMKNFAKDLVLLFIPSMTLCYSMRVSEIKDSSDTILQSLTKLICGYILGKIWAFAVHYALHHPSLYQYHRKHHGHPAQLVAARAWEDSLVEYAVMEIPSFAMTVLLFPTHLWVHLLHFCFHGYDGAAGHSGFGGVPGIMGFLFDGTYHYHHHARLTVNYAELEFLDLWCGTHHTQKKVPKAF
ncbi:fatty acid hydroxylase superfamily protein [Nitzschia inconspicua]|uniref:Fatty acid hydroxylase superfamily protein n=1 Tax=Nitzschia inconspicua TaxID=303405 RepID=A0A9K3M4B2_9STRA|nr:fatty acid hydroxylase superfamily protein [Nitzschia inconspicua]